MKRSHMIKLLKSTIKFTDPDQLAQRILEVIEQAGMLPPKRQITMENREEFGNLNEYEFYEYVHLENINKWEPEE